MITEEKKKMKQVAVCSSVYKSYPWCSVGIVMWTKDVRVCGHLGDIKESRLVAASPGGIQKDIQLLLYIDRSIILMGW